MTLPPLPDQGLPADEIMTALGELRAMDLDYTKATSYHFESGIEQLHDVATAAQELACRLGVMHAGAPLRWR